MNTPERLKKGTTTPEKQTSTLPGIKRVSNSTTARALALITALSAPGCGSEAYINGAESHSEGCDPVPSCPRPGLAAHGNFGDDYYLFEERWFRVNPETDEIIIVCDPTDRVFCEAGETPEEDGCNLPVCPGAQEAMCDPIPSRKDQDRPYRTPNQGGYPTDTSNSWFVNYVDEDNIGHPVIYDNTPDCKPGEDVEGDSVYSCDLIPTCEETIPYCDLLPRCAQGQSPISCTEGMAYSSYDACLDYLNTASSLIGKYGISLHEAENFCIESTYPNGNTYYQPPLVTVDCIHIPECKDGEEPYETTVSVDVDCGQWGSWTNTFEKELSCDPIKSCDQ